MKKITINQFHSIGDILFIEPIIRAFIEKGYQVCVPVRDHLMWIADYMQHKECFVPLSKAEKKGFVDHEFIKDDYIPLRFANQIMRGYDLNDHHDFENMMLDKYELVEKHYGIKADWKSIKLVFDIQKSLKLLESLGVNGKEYIFVNNMSQAGHIDIKAKHKNTVYLANKANYTLIDWYQALIFPREIHTVSTSILFLLQAIKNEGYGLPEVYIYPRPNQDGLRGIENLNFDYSYFLMK